MSQEHPTFSRRAFLQGSLRTAAVTAAGVAAGLPLAASAQEACVGRTPRQPEGPFYPERKRTDENTDLTVVDDRAELANGEIVLLRGQVLDQDCRPVANALVEIWQADRHGQYDHASDPNRTRPLDPNFQYWGKTTTGPDGSYHFKTIIPGAYPAGEGWIRPPHIHFKVSKRGHVELITQMYFAGDPLNDVDLILERIPSTERGNVIVDFKPDSELGARVGVFDIKLERLTR